jgi:hypothetical protein
MTKPRAPIDAMPAALRMLGVSVARLHRQQPSACDARNKHY